VRAVPGSRLLIRFPGGGLSSSSPAAYHTEDIERRGNTGPVSNKQREDKGVGTGLKDADVALLRGAEGTKGALEIAMME
jgi:hypothetical protein